MSSTRLLYTDHFGLKARPFSLLPDPDFLFWSENHARAYAMLEYGIVTFAPITMITGEVGAGKTTLVRHLLRSADQDLKIGLISNAHGERGELLHWILAALGQPVDSHAPYVELFSRLEAALRRERAGGRRTVLVFDEAQNLSETMLEELRCFSNLNGESDELLQIVLVGQPELRQTIAHPRLVQFAQRVAADFHLAGLTREGVRDYVSHRLTTAGAACEIFTPAACDMAFQASRGIPRVINQICDYALVYAFVDELDQVDEGVVGQVIADRGLKAQAPNPPERLGMMLSF
ncbi:AAA family ATPase [Aquamicrobium sp. LC103]|uniref:ExeA family protein n=1 Tax=Aquamicrobium sp. LC103 TaxID=1120658 RepID=UPI00063E7F7E|nr:AAA family ATPase [Aquamicrobium sp. LC103]TKT80277.1 ATPase [Aquamicrobium sp. LC103]